VVTKKQKRGVYAAVKPTVDEFIGARERMNRVSTEFLKIDLETALTFVKIARQTRDDVRKQRNCRAARRAYETVRQLANKVVLNGDDAQLLARHLTQLRSELEALGETF